MMASEEDVCDFKKATTFEGTLALSFYQNELLTSYGSYFVV